jgi:hypothetical protein
MILNKAPQSSIRISGYSVIDVVPVHQISDSGDAEFEATEEQLENKDSN